MLINMKKNILIACEYSGIVRNEFEKFGHHVVSCDKIMALMQLKELKKETRQQIFF